MRFSKLKEIVQQVTVHEAEAVTLADVQAAVDAGTLVVPGGTGGGVALEDVQTALNEGTIAVPTAAIQDALNVGQVNLPQPPPWRGFKHAGPVPQSFWNSWDSVPDTPALFRRVNNQIQMTGVVAGGVQAPGNAVVQMPDDSQAVAGSQDFEGDLRVVVIGGHTYIVMIAGNQSSYDLSNIVYNAE